MLLEICLSRETRLKLYRYILEVVPLIILGMTDVDTIFELKIYSDILLLKHDMNQVNQASEK